MVKIAINLLTEKKYITLKLITKNVAAQFCLGSISNKFIAFESAEENSQIFIVKRNIQSVWIY